MCDSYHSFIMNRASIAELVQGINHVYFNGEEIICDKEENNRNYLFSIRCDENNSFLIPIKDNSLYLGDQLVTVIKKINNRSLIALSNKIEVLYFEIKVKNDLRKDIQSSDHHALILNYLESGYSPKIDLNELLRIGSEKLQTEEFFSIMAQVDVPEIDQ